MKLALHVQYVRGGASMYLKKTYKKYSIMASFGAWDFCRQ